MSFGSSVFAILCKAPSESSTKLVAKCEVTSVFSIGVLDDMNSTQFFAFSTSEAGTIPSRSGDTSVHNHLHSILEGLSFVSSIEIYAIRFSIGSLAYSYHFSSSWISFSGKMNSTTFSLASKNGVIIEFLMIENIGIQDFKDLSSCFSICLRSHFFNYGYG